MIYEKIPNLPMVDWYRPESSGVDDTGVLEVQVVRYSHTPE